MSYGTRRTGGSAIAIRRRRAPIIRGKKGKEKEEKKTKATSMDGVNERSKTKRNNEPKKPNSGNVVKRLTKAQLDRLKSHSKMHGGMGSKHMRKMMLVMRREGRSFSEAHKIAVKHDKIKK